MQNQEIVAARVRETNGGGLWLECYNIDGDIVAVIGGMEYNPKAEGYQDLVGIVEGRWTYTDAGQYYDNEGNSAGDKDKNGNELTAPDMVDNDTSTRTIANYDGKTVSVYVSRMGRNGQVYFGISPSSAGGNNLGGK